MTVNSEYFQLKLPVFSSWAICCCYSYATGYNWKRPHGRPHTTCIHKIHWNTGIPVTNALELAADRSF